MGEVAEAGLLQAIDWLYERQERIEKGQLHDEGFVLYDLSSSYLT
jgi:hypothetical protein